MKEFDRLYDIVLTLRGEGGCPWDREQTPRTVTSDLVEEVYETIEAIEDNKIPDAKEELGDLMFLVLFISRMYEENGDFTTAGVIDEVSEKLVRRHPHVFGDKKVKNIKEILIKWETIKSAEKKNAHRKTPFDGIPKRLPEIQRFDKVLEKARRADLSIPDVKGQELSEALYVFIKNKNSESLSDFLEKFLIYSFQNKLSLPPVIRKLGIKAISDYKNLLKK
jgi:MazG family protein